ncbi:E3 ubiquitin-protein ligase ATL6-like [Punica granatum]|uniref:RING-type E3 ubiquitin transferase n=2 Tax=Punica granatum TaxID=22663 RepID=A0A218X5B1_PUNGR|nr:E3 ubiquitin-protein ligase ATL6-like [Punica granatum]OWM79988.1 hypothetical protein CDL15_Pgr006292 [Punica granatum]PKI47337.1 hypothetical protein CRG98_032262 [Punica granatum]
MGNHNHPPLPNHSRSSLPRPNHGPTTSRPAALTPLLLLLLLLLQLHPAAGQNDAGTPPPNQQPGPYPYGQRFNPSMAIIMVVLVSAFFLMGFLSVYIRQCAAYRFRGGASDQTERPYLFGLGAARGIDTSVIDSFPTFQYSSVKGLKIGKGSLECAVCLNEFEDDDVLRLLPRCNHVFHSNCIDVWLSSHNTCPVCRDNLLPKPGEKFDPPILDVAEPEPIVPTSDMPDQVRVCVEDERGTNLESQLPSQVDISSPPTNKSRPPRSRSTGMRFARLLPFPRSHSTGHSWVQPGEDHERFTLRLPEDVRIEIIRTASLNRANSCATAFPRSRSARTGYRRSDRNGGGRSIRGRNYFNYERFDQEDQAGRWGFSGTPPFIGRTRSVRSAKGDDIAMTPPQSRPETLPPISPLFIGKDGDDDDRSSDRLQPPDSQV